MTKQETITTAVNLRETQRLVVYALLAMCLLLTGQAYAAGFEAPPLTGISMVLCNAAYIVLFDVGRGLSSIAIVAVGVAAMLGKATWGQAMSLGVGIGLVYGSLTLTATLITGVTTVLSVSLPPINCMPI